MAQPSYPQALPLQPIAQRLARALANPSQTFIAADYSLLDAGCLNWNHLLGHRQIADSYLLGLAVRHQCRFVTFDARMSPSVVIGANADHWVTL